MTKKWDWMKRKSSVSERIETTARFKAKLNMVKKNQSTNVKHGESNIKQGKLTFFRITSFGISKNMRNNWVQILIHQPTPPQWYKDRTQSQVAPHTDWSLADLTMTPCDVIALGQSWLNKTSDFAVVVAFSAHFHLNKIFYLKVFFFILHANHCSSSPSPTHFFLQPSPQTSHKGYGLPWGIYEDWHINLRRT